MDEGPSTWGGGAFESWGFGNTRGLECFADTPTDKRGTPWPWFCGRKVGCGFVFVDPRSRVGKADFFDTNFLFSYAD